MDVSKHVEKAEEALRKKNFDYAVGLVHQVLSLQPDSGEAYRVLCDAARQRGERKPTPAWLAKLVGLPHLLSSGISKMTRNPAGRARALAKYLKLEPKNSGLYLNLGQCLMSAGHMNAATAVFTSLGESGPKEGEAWKLAAMCNGKLQRIDEALECLEKALEANPRDAEAERLRKNMAADATLRSGAYDQARSSRDLMKDKDQAKKLEREERIHRSEDELEEERQELEAALKDNPADGRARRRLAELRRKAGDFDAAIQLLEEGLAGDDNVSDLRDRIGDLRLAALQKEIQKLKVRLDEAPSDNAKADLEDLRAEKLKLEVEEYRRRAEERPTDLALWYNLGKGLQTSGELDEAISAFQKSVKDPKSRVDSLMRLGSCFHKKGLFDLAEKQLQAALEETPETGDRGKAILYNLGLVAEKADRPQDAFDYFTRIYEVDISYRDVAQKIEALRG